MDKIVHMTTYGVRHLIRPTAEHVTVSCLPIANPSRETSRDVIIMSPGFAVTYGLATEKILAALRAAPDGEPLEVGVHCLFGQHRSPVMAACLESTLTALGIQVLPTTHLCKDVQ